tara:strand:+ start:2593 stop:3045 length:453 start_codon:yes stop_codon:yes gene_type:complete
MLLITSHQEIKEYIEDLKFDILLYRLEQERIDLLDNTYPNLKPKTSEIIYSESLTSDLYEERVREYYYGRSERKSHPKSIDKSAFDGVVIEIKQQTLVKLLNKYPEGISIHPMGWMCPLGKEDYFESMYQITYYNKKINDEDKLFGTLFL